MVDYYLLYDKKNTPRMNHSDFRDQVIWMSSRPSRVKGVAELVVDTALAMPLSKPPCFVFDVDETLLINHPKLDNYFRAQPVGKELFDLAVARNIPIFVVTARRKSKWTMAFVIAQLKRLGYQTDAIKGFYMVPKEHDNSDDRGGAGYKKRARQIIGADYHILLNCGDRWGDCVLHHDNESDKGTVAEKIKYEGRYVGLTSAEPHILHSIKFPEEHPTDAILPKTLR